ncbi:ABC transporter ATP-binding protein, partial [Thermococci archaeon]
MIEVRNLWHIYDGKKDALKGISLTVGNE